MPRRTWMAMVPDLLVGGFRENGLQAAILMVSTVIIMNGCAGSVRNPLEVSESAAVGRPTLAAVKNLCYINPRVTPSTALRFSFFGDRQPETQQLRLPEASLEWTTEMRLVHPPEPEGLRSIATTVVYDEISWMDRNQSMIGEGSCLTLKVIHDERPFLSQHWIKIHYHNSSFDYRVEPMRWAEGTPMTVRFTAEGRYFDHFQGTTPPAHDR